MRTRLMGVGLAALLGLTVACGTDRNEPDINSMANDALRQEGIEDVRVDHDQDSRVVHLRGTVENEQVRQRAESAVQRAVGATTRIANEVVVEGREEMVDALDSRIKDRLDTLLDAHPVLKDRDVDFEVNGGVVTIKGDVRTSAEREQAEQMVRSAGESKDIVNALEVKPGDS